MPFFFFSGVPVANIFFLLFSKIFFATSDGFEYLPKYPVNVDGVEAFIFAASTVRFIIDGIIVGSTNILECNVVLVLVLLLLKVQSLFLFIPVFFG